MADGVHTWFGDFVIAGGAAGKHFDDFSCPGSHWQKYSEKSPKRFVNGSIFRVQAHREPQRGPGKHYRGALSPPILYVLRSREDTWGEVSPHHPTKGSGERRKLPQRGPGRPKIDLMHILGQKEAIWNTVFGIFERRRGPQMSRGPGTLSPFSPLYGPVLKTQWTALKWAARDWAAQNWAARNWAARNRDTTFKHFVKQ